jgi:hypothetical protein
MAAWPHAHDEAGWDTLLADDTELAAGVDAILARHGLARAPRTRYDSGSLPVYAVGDAHVLKLYPSRTSHAPRHAPSPPLTASCRSPLRGRSTPACTRAGPTC